MRKRKNLGKLSIDVMGQNFQPLSAGYKSSRLAFDELAEMLPTVNENDQSEYVGGAYVYGGNGALISNMYMVPDPSSLYVISADDTYYCGSISVNVYSSAPMPFSQANSSERSNIIKSIASSIGMSMVTTVEGSFYGNAADCDRNGLIQINLNSMFLLNNNYNDIMLILIHEKHHADTLWDFGTNNSEYEAYLAMRNSYYYTYCSQSAKNGIDVGLSKYKP